MGVVSTGIRRRARLLGEALRPPRATTFTATGRSAARQADTTATRTAQTARATRTGGENRPRRPPKETVAVTYTVPTASRLVESPVFVLAPVRSGSTLLRMLLNSHSRIRAPHELHLRAIDVRLTPGFSDRAMQQLDLDQPELEHVLWDRVLSLELERSGKDVIVDKTPGNVWTWQRLAYAWPKARFIVLLRHPAAIVSSLANRRHNTSSWRELEANVLKYLEPLEEARQTLECLTVRYEELTAEPERVTREICRYLGVEWEAGMLDYGAHDHGPLLPNLGDRSTKIRSGRVQPAGPPEGADRLSQRLREIAHDWNYE